MKTVLEQNDLDAIAEKVVARIKPLFNRQEMPELRYLNREEAAKLLGVLPSWLENNDKEQKIPRYKFGGKIYYSNHDLIKWARKQKLPEEI